MIIESVALSLPSWEVNNEEVVDLIKHHSKPVFQGDLDRTLRVIDVMLRKTGAETRFWLNRQKKERPIDFIKQAAEEALTKVNLHKNDIDLLIYVGIGKGFVEPGESYFVAKALGMDRVRCFDLTDACMSWLAAMQIVNSLFQTKEYKRAMIINGEFNVHAGSLFKNYTLEKIDQLEHTFPSYTIGEGATCTIVSPLDPNNFSFDFSSRPDLADLCVIPLPDYEDYADTAEKIKNGAMRFTSFGAKLHEVAELEAVKLFRQMSVNRGDIDIIFTHASSKREWSKYGENAGIADKIFHIYQKTGNLVSASVPAAMSMAIDSGHLKRNNKVMAWVGSAGMSFCGCTFRY